MRTTKRIPAAGVIEQLAEEPYRFQLSQAVRLLLRWLGQRGVGYEQAMTEVLRFKNSLAQAFPASEIESLHVSGGDQGHLADVSRLTDLPASLSGKVPACVVITPTVIGFLGVSGTLPFHYTQRIGAQHWSDKDESAQAFIDSLSNRMVMLYCQTWGKHRVEYARDVRGVDTQLPRLLALAGVQGNPFHSGELSTDVAAFYAGLLRMRPVSASAIANVLKGYFNVPVKVQEFVGSWDAIPPPMRSTLGTENPSLGYGATLGSRLWRHDKRLRLVIGPLDSSKFTRFLPKGDATAALSKLVTLFATQGLEYEVEISLTPDCVSPLIIGSGKRLGWETFLLGPSSNGRHKSIGYLLRPS
ncbi:type VI secretion system protein ImpH [Duganella sp. CF517]|uniref:type VI secretion system baseplate subunit TssG n=1 Tax=Duganella sp. CF517 TaxID=1881038 RepID=UPI0008B2A019|nr:type VI secretion system baseplate subunit TssG [Duganella sp. CF517]SEN76709.1 type VI secretion system protein ImpH [Duganella sp. CF517]